jgi:zinc transport system ATP-binding protein
VSADLPVLEAKCVSVWRERRALVQDVSLEVARGSIHALIGPNGAGKSTLLAAFLGQTAFTGKVAFHFQKSGAIGFVPQTVAVDRTLPVTVAELFALSRQRLPVCLGVGKAARKKCGALLERVGLSGFESRRLGALSGGELQRVLFANALDPEPEMLILDEPASGIDEKGVALVENLLMELRATGMSALIVSHDIRQVRRIADGATYIHRIVKKQGSLSDVLGDRAAFPFGAPSSGTPRTPGAE